MNRQTLAVLAALTVAAGSTQARPDYSYSGPPIPIPDGVDPQLCATNPGADAVATINVPNSFSITGITISLYVQHTYQSDLQFDLRHNGTTVVLMDRPGSDGVICGFSNDNYGASASSLMRLTDAAAFTYDTGNPGVPIDNVTGDWKPENPLAAFNGMNSSGSWELHVRDCAGQDTGTIIAVTISLAGGAAPCYANCDGSTVQPILNVNDFICFQTKYAAGDTYANCDGSTVQPILNVNDFICFQTRYAAGCP